MIIANAAGGDGGGAFGGTLQSCKMLMNWTPFYGGGAAGIDANRGTLCTLKSCVLSGNSASYGGGVSGATALNCNIIANTAFTAGGAYQTVLSNCIVYYNNATFYANYPGPAPDHCCIVPLPAAGVGNIDSDP